VEDGASEEEVVTLVPRLFSVPQFDTSTSNVAYLIITPV
jgi:hypothetical protein